MAGFDLSTEDATAAQVRTLSLTSSASRSRSSRRNGARPRPATTTGSGGAKSVQPTGIDQTVPSGRCTVTRSSPHRDFVTTNGKRVPRSGWNGWVIRICGASTAPGAFCSFEECDGRELLRDPGVRAARPNDAVDARRSTGSVVRVHRGVVQHAAASLLARLPVATGVRTAPSGRRCGRCPACGRPTGAHKSVGSRAAHGIHTAHRN